MKSITLLQDFEWDLPADCKHWNRTAEDAEYFAKLGITDVWMPPAYKGEGGIYNVGYGAYDLYDLGEFDQKNTIPTKYGTKDEYLAAIKALHDQGIRVVADVVMNHRMGADGAEELEADVVANDNRNWVFTKDQKIKAWTKFTFPGRNGKYSTFTWNASHFDGVDYDASAYWHEQGKLYRFKGKEWDDRVHSENGNADYVMGADIDFGNEEVIAETENWGKWYFDFTGVDGVRLDAVKHISTSFYEHWLKVMREHVGKDFFAVGEYWSSDVNTLGHYLEDCGGAMQLFDVPLHYNFYAASKMGRSYNLTTIFDNTLTQRCPWRSVTFVDNHDSQPGQQLNSWVDGWFRPLAYALILLRLDGVPCVFYGDLKGIPSCGIAPMGEELEKMIQVRHTYATGAQTDYFDFPNVVGWTREGGAAVVISNGDDGWKHMRAGIPGQIYVDLLGNRTEEITIDEWGWADFTCNGGSVSVWVPKE